MATKTAARRLSAFLMPKLGRPTRPWDPIKKAGAMGGGGADGRIRRPETESGRLWQEWSSIAMRQCDALKQRVAASQRPLDDVLDFRSDWTRVFWHGEQSTTTELLLPAAIRISFSGGIAIGS